MKQIIAAVSHAPGRTDAAVVFAPLLVRSIPRLDDATEWSVEWQSVKLPPRPLENRTFGCRWSLLVLRGPNASANFRAFFLRVPPVHIFLARELLLHGGRIRRARRLREGSRLPNHSQRHSPRPSQPSRLRANEFVVTAIAPRGAKRVFATEVNQSCTLRRAVSLLASCEPFTGSSITSTFAPRPVAGPPVPNAKYPPPCRVLKRWAAVESALKTQPGKMARCSGSATEIPDLPTEIVREFLRITGEHYVPIGMPTKAPTGESRAAEKTFSVARRKKNHQSRNFPTFDGFELRNNQLNDGGLARIARPHRNGSNRLGRPLPTRATAGFESVRVLSSYPP